MRVFMPQRFFCFVVYLYILLSCNPMKCQKESNEQRSHNGTKNAKCSLFNGKVPLKTNHCPLVLSSLSELKVQFMKSYFYEFDISPSFTGPCARTMAPLLRIVTIVAAFLVTRWKPWRLTPWIKSSQILENAYIIKYWLFHLSVHKYKPTIDKPNRSLKYCV